MSTDRTAADPSAICPTVEPTPEHQWLHQLVGDWTYQSECSMGPDQPPFEAAGRETVRKLGELWVVGEMEGPIPGGQSMRGIMTLGFDPGRGKFIGTWVGSPMTTMFVYEGDLDDARKVLTLNTTGPSFLDPAATANYHDIVEFTGDGRRIMRSEFQAPDGTWHEFMRGVFTRA